MDGMKRNARTFAASNHRIGAAQMNRTLVAACIALALVSGFAGGVASRIWNAPPVFAQEFAHPKNVSSQSFILVNPAGDRRGLLTQSRDGSVVLRLYDEHGVGRIEMGIPASGAKQPPTQPDIRILSPEGRITWSANGGMLPLGKDIY
jgi:hypothetical protein